MLRGTVRVRFWHYLDRPLSRHIRLRFPEFRNPVDSTLTYTKLPNFCGNCGRIGHKPTECDREIPGIYRFDKCLLHYQKERKDKVYATEWTAPGRGPPPGFGCGPPSGFAPLTHNTPPKAPSQGGKPPSMSHNTPPNGGEYGATIPGWKKLVEGPPPNGPEDPSARPDNKRDSVGAPRDDQARAGKQPRQEKRATPEASGTIAGRDP